MITEELKKLYIAHTGHEPEQIDELPSSGSNRRYFRLIGNPTLIGVSGESVEENRAFLYMAEHFRQKGLPVPQVFIRSEDDIYYLQEDLGDSLLFNAIEKGRKTSVFGEDEKQLLRKTIRLLPAVQFAGADGMDFSYCYPQAEFNSRSILWDLNYFKYCFLKPSELDFHELKLEANFRLFAKDLTSEKTDSFLYRDFQARNIMLDPNNNPYFIDFQGGRKGPYYYDLASFLWQASARYSNKLRRDLVAEYYDALKQYTEVPSVRHFVGRLSLFVLFRTLQVLGAYGFRGYFERKKHFIESIPPAIQNLRDLLKMGEKVFPYPYMMDVLRRLTELPQFKRIESAAITRADGYKITDNNIYSAHPQDGPATYSKYDGKGPLVVRVFSFSFKKGIPEDPSGNGGGYVFDCRSTHNPGRYEPYKKLTGLDEPVIRFLEDDGEILTFLESVYKLADHHVNRYIQRGFTSLMFCFGCTGGQHRSVYSAQHLAEHIHEKFGVEVQICHREQHIEQVLPAKQ